jgi:hypothetical protein
MRKNARILAASIVGTAVEYYDFYLYGYAAALAALMSRQPGRAR